MNFANQLYSSDSCVWSHLVQFKIRTMKGVGAHTELICTCEMTAIWEVSRRLQHLPGSRSHRFNIWRPLTTSAGLASKPCVNTVTKHQSWVRGGGFICVHVVGREGVSTRTYSSGRVTTACLQHWSLPN